MLSVRSRALGGHLAPRFLLDTHVLIRALTEVHRLSREQRRVIGASARRGESVALSAMSLLEISMLMTAAGERFRTSLADLFRQLEGNPVFHVLPITIEIAEQAGALSGLRDPGDRVIVATARIHRLTLLTSDQRIIESRLVPVDE